MASDRDNDLSLCRIGLDLMRAEAKAALDGLKMLASNYRGRR